MPSIPFPPYEPDKNRFNSGALPFVNNVVPAADGWGPLSSIIPTPAIYAYLTDPESGSRLTDENGNRLIVGLDWSGIAGFLRLPDACTGMFAARRKDGVEVLFAGTASKLYKFDRDKLVWNDVSSTTYDSAVRWSFFRWGDVVYCQNGHDPEQKFNIETDSVFSDNPSAPICKITAVVGNFVFRFNIVSWAAEGITNEPLMFMCSALENPEDNIVGDYNWCDFQFVPVGDEIMAVVPVTGGAHIWLRSGVVPMSVVMTNGVTFVLGDVDTSRGTSAPYSLCSFGQDRYIIYTDDGLWSYNSGFTPIGQDRVNRTFLANCDQDTFEDILSMNDPENAVIWIQYTNTDGERRMLGYQYNLDRFTASDIAATASFVCRTFVYAESDPPILKANQPRFSIIDSNGQLGYLVGDPLEARVMTNEVQMGEVRSFENVARLDGDPVDFMVTTITRDIKGGEPRKRQAEQPSQQTGGVPFSAEGQTHQWQVDIPAGAKWSTVSGINVPSKPAGK